MEIIVIMSLGEGKSVTKNRKTHTYIHMVIYLLSRGHVQNLCWGRSTIALLNELHLGQHWYL